MNKVLRWTVGVAFLVFMTGLVFLSCTDEWYLGKSKEELMREMFVVDSLIKDIQYQLDSTTINFEKIYIDAQRINNGHN
tara:strand:- start:880 stop:1116 length:237 start_codon:yes stop_codon:yes gene_type:complete